MMTRWSVETRWINHDFNLFWSAHVFYVLKLVLRIIMIKEATASKWGKVPEEEEDTKWSPSSQQQTIIIPSTQQISYYKTKNSTWISVQ